MGKTAWLVALVVLLVGILIIEVQQFRVLERIASTMTSSGIVQTGLNTTWQSGGQTITVHTDPHRGESDAALLVRHENEVKNQLQLHPLDH